MEKSILITGGARSGKSVLAERLALRATGRAIYIATAETRGDPEMEARVAQHQARRGTEWVNLTAPYELAGALRDSDGTAPRLVDCLTLWLTNLILAERDWKADVAGLVNELDELASPVVFVTNEVGQGIVPENQLARQFRDASGWMNQRVADASDRVLMCVSGYPLQVKPPLIEI
ncbi:MAG: bifunctional adenosylcobinamide kinase/adenosylcobinamide-phosphate guanylyltransferase [Arenibacterium sp.]